MTVIGFQMKTHHTQAEMKDVIDQSEAVRKTYLSQIMKQMVKPISN